MSIQVKAARLDDWRPAEEVAIFDRWATEIFAGTPAATQFTWVNHWAYRVVVYRDSVPVSHLRIVDRTALIDDRHVRLGGVADVMTPAEHRGKGFAGVAVDAARRAIFEAMNARLGMLFCRKELVPFYARHGWQEIDCPVTIDQPGGKQIWPQCTMLLTGPGDTWAPKAIDICGLPW